VERLEPVVFNAQLVVNCVLFRETRNDAVSTKSSRSGYMNRIMIGNRLHLAVRGQHRGGLR
jgi:hypothetical protein